MTHAPERRRRLVTSILTMSLCVVMAAPVMAGDPPRQPRPRAGDRGPLDPLVTREIHSAFQVIERSGRMPEGAYFPTVTLKEPPKGELLAWRPGDPFRREAFVNVYDQDENRTWEAVVDLNARELLSWTEVTGVQPAIFYTEYEQVEELVRADPRWQAAIRARGIEPDEVYMDAGWGVGDLVPDGVPEGTRLLRAISFYRGPFSNPYDRPIEGVIATVDMNRQQVVEVIDSGVVPVDTTTSGDPAPVPRSLKPLRVVQPDGPSFRLRGNQVSWLGWRFRVGFNQREGLVLHQVGYRQGDETRSIISRLAMTEIFVPYADPHPDWAWRSALDVGEYNLGQLAEPLERGVDVPHNAVFLDQGSPGDTGSGADEPEYLLPNAVALYERDAGVLWDRMDPSTYERDTRRGRQLVVTSAYANGNYTYLIEYAFGMDGTIEVQAAGTGTTLNRGYVPGDERPQHGTPVSASVAAPTHQHFFSFRIDFDVDGTRNHVAEESERAMDPPDANGFETIEEHLFTEGFRDADPASGRHWVIHSSERTNAWGRPTGYELVPDDVTQVYADPEWPTLSRARFAEHPFWVTRYREGELSAVGDYPNQGQAEQGLPGFVADGEDIHHQDLVVWFTAGFTHRPEVEDYPAMAPDVVRFTLEPSGFFDRDPSFAAP